jgi:prevent-host-death family protein
MAQINIHDAKTHFSKLIERVEGGEEVVIARYGRPVAILKPYRSNTSRRRLGIWEGRVRIGDDFDDPLPAPLADAFGSAE